MVTHALALVIEHLHSNAQARASMALMGNPPSSAEQGDTPSTAAPPAATAAAAAAAGGTTSVKLLIAKGAGGLVIGRGGATIKVR